MISLSKYKIYILCMIIFLIIGFMVMGKSEGILFDYAILEYLHQKTNPTLLKVMKLISFIGSYLFITPLMTAIIIFNFIKKNYYISKLLILSTLGTWILNYILKQIFQRIRPIDFFIVDQSGFSYPSGHTMVATTFYLTKVFLLTRNIRDESKKIFYYLIAFIFIFLMALSRLYLGVHWPTDVIGGFLIGYVLYNTYIFLIRE